MNTEVETLATDPIPPSRITPRRWAIISSQTTRRSRSGGRTRWTSSSPRFNVRPQPATPLGIYLHIPFCRKRCHFCYFRVYTDKDSAAISGYIDAALKELALYARQPFIGGRKPNFIYFGGGTPSYLSAKQLEHLTERDESAPPVG